MIQRHSQFRGPGRREDNVVGTPMWPGYALRSLGLFAAVAAVLVLMGGLIQINPIWLWGPYHPYIGTNGAQPDWYLGWLIGALRLMPNLEISVIGPHSSCRTHSSGASCFRGSSSRCSTPCHGLTGASSRTTIAATICWSVRAIIRGAARSPPRCSRCVLVVFAAGSADRLFFQFGFGYEGAIWFFRVMVFLVPVVVFAVTRRICVRLARVEAHPLREWDGQVVTRNGAGGFEIASSTAQDAPDHAESAH